ncbi:MAG TPA: protease HtpX [Steroidobacteraceae bacterium]
MKRIILLVATNLAILIMLSVAARLLGLDSWIAARGGSFSGLLAFAALFGFGGAFASLLLSKWIARRTMGVRTIEQPANDVEAWLVETVRGQARAAGIGMPEVGIFDSPAPNAFATGARRDNSLVAVSTGLLQTMRRQEVEAVLAHEISHVANGDMVTLTLIQGVLNTFVIVLARIVGGAVDRMLSRGEGERGPGYFIAVLVSELLLGVLASLIVMAFSRYREFRADRGGAQLAGTGPMISALESLKRSHGEPLQAPQLAALGISGTDGTGFRRLFMSHPPLDERIEALRAATFSGEAFGPSR